MRRSAMWRRHAEAGNVTIRLFGTEEAIVLEIEDDGRGFDVDKPVKRGHLGLAGMKERAELLGGEFHVASRPGGPTVISVVLQTWSPPPESDPLVTGVGSSAARLRPA